MELVCLFSIIMVVILVRSATVKNKKPPSNQGEYGAEEQPVKVRPNKPKAAVAKRIGEAAGKSRIHRNIKNADIKKAEEKNTIEIESASVSSTVKPRETTRRELKIDTRDIMLSVKEIMVCGYPVNIPGERDFVKEGEDFLESFKTDSLFL